MITSIVRAPEIGASPFNATRSNEVSPSLLSPGVGSGSVSRSAAVNSTAPPASSTRRSEEHTSELQSLMRISYAVFCLKKKTHTQDIKIAEQHTQPQRQQTKITTTIQTYKPYINLYYNKI